MFESTLLSVFKVTPCKQMIGKPLEMAWATRAILRRHCNTNEKPQQEDCPTMPNS